MKSLKIFIDLYKLNKINSDFRNQRSISMNKEDIKYLIIAIITILLIALDLTFLIIALN